MKMFTLDEAQSLLPVLESLLARADAAAQEGLLIEERQARLKMRIFQAGGLAVDVTAVMRDHQSLAAHRQTIAEVQEELTSVGVQIKDLTAGLLDFPFQLASEVVLLCWKRGESRIEYWHSVDEGFAGRKKLDARFGRVSKVDRLN